MPQRLEDRHGGVDPDPHAEIAVGVADVLRSLEAFHAAKDVQREPLTPRTTLLVTAIRFRVVVGRPHRRTASARGNLFDCRAARREFVGSSAAGGPCLPAKFFKAGHRNDARRVVFFRRRGDRAALHGPGLAAGNGLLRGHAVQRPLEALEVFGGKDLLRMDQEAILVHPREISLRHRGGQLFANLLPSQNGGSGVAVGVGRHGHSADARRQQRKRSKKTMNESHDTPLCDYIIPGLGSEANAPRVRAVAAATPLESLESLQALQSGISSEPLQSELDAQAAQPARFIRRFRGTAGIIGITINIYALYLPFLASGAYRGDFGRRFFLRAFIHRKLPCFLGFSCP